ncbi:MAG: glyoxalase [Marmoricola sp.]|nr:glyoxalase [Marmoricola sp.]
MVSIDEVFVADPPEAWAAAGFAVDDDGVCRVGTLRIRLVGRERGTGIVGWSLRGLASGLVPGDLDGLPTEVSVAPVAESWVHPNGVTGIDHLVLLSPGLDRTVAALAVLGLEPRRERAGELGGRAIRQIFFRFDEVILEVVGSPDTTAEGPSTLWGVTYVVEDLDATASYFGDLTGPVKDAVQPGRRITTLRNRDLGISVRTALISPTIRDRR